VEDEKHAIDNFYSFGPSFGSEDLKIFNNRIGYCKKNSYNIQIRCTVDKFFIEEYEIFQIKV
jgi:hypothetical protein